MESKCQFLKSDSGKSNIYKEEDQSQAPITRPLCQEPLFISEVVLSPEETSVLNRGLNFALPFSTFNYNRLLKIGFDTFLFDLNNKYQLHSQSNFIPNKDSRDLKLYRKFISLQPPPIKQLPLKLMPHAKTLVNTFHANIRLKSNYNRVHSTVLDSTLELVKNKDILVTCMDKGKGFVILRLANYLKMGKKLLSNPLLYSDLTCNFKPQEELIKLMHLNRGIFKSLICSKSVTQNMFEMATAPSFNFSTIYLMVKAHKPKDSDGLYKSRPIISSFGTVFKYLDKLLEFILSPLLKLIPSKIKNTSHLLEKLKLMEFSADSSFTSFDIKDMFPSISHYEAALTLESMVQDNIGFLNAHLKQFNLKVPKPSMLKFLVLAVMRNNVFTFCGSYFKAVRGIAMGSNISVLLAEIFVFKKIELNLNLHHLNIALWGRYMDDVISLSHLKDFHPQQTLDFLDGCSNLKFTFEGPVKELNFLDLTLSNLSGDFTYQPYSKTTDKHAFLHFDSHHPLYIKKAVIWSTLSRIKTSCSSCALFDVAVEQLYSRLMARGYPHNFIEYHIKQFRDSSIESAISRKHCSTFLGVPLVLPYSRANHFRVTKSMKYFNRALKSLFVEADWVNYLLPKLIYKGSPTLSTLLFKCRKALTVVK